jgi:hypothetical protein
MSVEDLKKLIAPPKKPLEAGTAKKWDAIEKELGTELPADYREFITTYGTGLFAGFYRVLNPFAKDPYSNLVIAAQEMGDQLREYPDDVDYPVFPEAGGLLYFANDENGNTYYWLTKGTPDKWTVVQREERGEGFKAQKCSMSKFLAGVLNKKIKALASGYPRKECMVFKPFEG